MAAIDALVSAILDDVKTNLTSWPVVWPNEQFDPASPPSGGGHLSGFAANVDHVLAQVTIFAASQETHGGAGAGRSRDGAAEFFARTARGKGPKAATVIAKTIEARYRTPLKLLDEVEFGTPMSDEIGEVDGWYVWRTRCPFYQITLAA